MKPSISIWCNYIESADSLSLPNCIERIGKKQRLPLAHTGVRVHRIPFDAFQDQSAYYRTALYGRARMSRWSRYHRLLNCILKSVIAHGRIKLWLDAQHQ